MNIREEQVKSNFKYFGGISVIYGIIFSFCVYQNLFGATFFIYALMTVLVLTIFLNKIDIHIKRETKVYFTAVLLCGVSTCMTSNEGLQLFNLFFIIGLFIVGMVQQFFNYSGEDIFSYILHSIMVFFTTIKYIFLSTKETFKFIKSRNIEKEIKEKKNLSFVLMGVILAVGMLFIVFPLLISSDLMFRRLFSGLFERLSFTWFVPNITTLVGVTLTAFAGFAIIYAFFYAVCHIDFNRHRNTLKENYHPVTGISFTAVIGAIYLLYSVVQFVYLFLGAGELPDGITYSIYARQGFWQLTAVATMNILLVIVCTHLFKENKLLKWMLTLISGCTFIMIASAAYRMYLYVAVYHLTFLRLLVLCFLLILALIMSVVIVSIYKKGFPLVRYIVLITVTGYLLFSFAQPDYWIAKYNVSHMEVIEEQDLNYMLFGLSQDAAPVVAEINQQDTYAGHNEVLAHQFKGKMYSYFKGISSKNANLSFREANVSKLRARKLADDYIIKHAEDQIYSEEYISGYEYNY